MLNNGYFEHDGPNESWDARIARYLKAPLTGENIAWGNGSYGTPAGIVSQWMHCPTHRAIILTPGLHRIGLGLITGTFDHPRRRHRHRRLRRLADHPQRSTDLRFRPGTGGAARGVVGHRLAAAAQ